MKMFQSTSLLALRASFSILYSVLRLERGLIILVFVKWCIGAWVPSVEYLNQLRNNSINRFISVHISDFLFALFAPRVK